MPVYRFGDFELDPDERQLRRGGARVHLERRPMDLLVLLVSRHGRLVGRDTLISTLWPARVIIDFDSGLNTLVRKVRNALGDDTETPRFVETVAGRGYRFIAEVSEPAPVTPEVAATESKARHSWYLPAIVASLLVLVTPAILVIPRPVTGPESSRIAVLPFENLTGDASLDYMASGLAEETSTSLAQIDLENLSVVGGISARTAAVTAQPLSKIGSELGVDYLVTSLLQRDGTLIRVTARLLRTSDGEQLWSASFDRELTNVLGLQRDLSIAIAEQVRQRLSPDVAAAIDRRQTRNPQAYQLYLKGRDQWTRFTPDSTDKALQFYRQAVDVDPGYALAWAGIAHALATAPMTADAEPAIVVPEATLALQRAMQFGPDLAETHFALAVYRLFLDWDYPGSVVAAQVAVDLDPNSALAHMILAMALLSERRYVESNAAMRRALQLDPFFSLLFVNAANAALASGDRQQALEYARQAIANGPDFWPGYLHLGRAYRSLGRNEDALEAFNQALRYSDGNSKAYTAVALLLLNLGRESEALDLLDRMTAEEERRYFPPYATALVYAALGQKDLAFEYLERAISAHDVHLIGLSGDSRLASMRDDPRFDSLLRRCNCERHERPL